MNALHLLGLAATEPEPLAHADGAGVWKALWDRLERRSEYIRFRDAAILVRASAASDSMLSLSVGTPTGPRHGFAEYYPAKAGTRDVVDVFVDVSEGVTRTVRFRISHGMTPVGVLATVIKSFHGIVASIGVTAAAEPDADAYSTYLALLRQLTHANPGKTISEGVSVRSYHAHGDDHELHTSYISIRVLGTLFSVGVNNTTPPGFLTINSAAAKPTGFKADVDARAKSPAELLQRIVGVAVRASKHNHVQAAAEPGPARGRLSVSFTGNRRVSRAKAFAAEVTGHGVTATSNRISDRDVWVIVRLPARADAFKQAMGLILKHSTSSQPLHIYTGRGYYDLTKLPENLPLIWNAFLSTTNEAVAAAEPTPHHAEITWADVVAAVPTKEEYAARVRARNHVVRLPAIYSLDHNGNVPHQTSLVVIGRNCHAKVLDSGVSARIVIRRGPYNGGAGPILPQIGQPLYLAYENYGTAKELLVAALREFVARTGMKIKAQAAAEPQQAQRDFADVWLELVDAIPTYEHRKRIGTGDAAVTVHVDSKVPSAPWAERIVFSTDTAHAFLALPAEASDFCYRKLELGLPPRRLRTEPTATLTFYPGPRPTDNNEYRTLRSTHVARYDLVSSKDTKSLLREVLTDFNRFRAHGAGNS